ncbi:MAG: hypothetical protein K9H64_04170 [Bacteroidales bacterium]|nr:hypothetical protein [Bacteroidales bacterium]MCF8455036.1 hypothetical protein [Bacteroidales bacterium]
MKTNVKCLILILALLLTSGLGSISYAQCDFSSDFESGTLTDWSIVAGTNVVSTQQVHSGNYALKMTNSGSYPKILSNQNNFSYGEYTAWFYMTQSYAAGYLQFHHQDANNYYQVGLVPQGTWNPALTLTKKVGGVNTFLANIPPVFPQNSWIKLTVIRNLNNEIVVKINDVIQFSVIDTTFTQPGKVAVWGYDYTTYFDDFCYTATSVPTNDCDIYYDFEDSTLLDWTVTTGSINLSQFVSVSGNNSVKMFATGAYPTMISNIDTFGFGSYSAWFWLTGPNTDVYFRFHYQNSNNFYQLGMLPQNTDNPKLKLTKKVNGSTITLAQTPPVFGINQWFKMTVDRYANGDIKIYINSSLQISVNDSTFMTPTQIVFSDWDPTTYMDDFCYKQFPDSSAAIYSIQLGSDVFACEGDSIQLSAGSGLLNYIWNGGLAYGSILNVINSGTYYVQAEDPAGAVFTDTIVVSFYPTPVVNLGNDTTICPYDTLNLNTGSTGYNYLWSTSETTDTIVVIPPTSTTYTVLAESNGCYSSDTMVVTVIDTFTVSLINDTTLCNGSSVVLYPSGSNSSYVWSTDQSSDSIIVNSTGMYSVTATNMCGLTAEDSVYILFVPIPNVDLGNNLNFCIGDSILLNCNTPFSTYLWSTNETTQAIQVSTTGFYFVFVSNICGTASDVVFVDEVSPPLLNLTDTSICTGDTAYLDSQNPGYSYQWTTGDTSQVVAVSPALSTIYVVTVSNSGCSSSDTIHVEVIPLPSVFLGNDTIICVKDTILLDAGNAGASYSWSNGYTSQTIEIYPLVPEQVWVNVSMSGCESSDSIFIDIFPGPVAQLGNDTSFCIGSSLFLDAGNPNCNYLWSTGEITQQINISDPGYYSVWIENQCEETIEDTIFVDQNALPVINLGEDTILNIGQSLLLNAGSGFQDYLWSDGSTNANILLDSINLSPGYNEIIILITDSNSCSGSDTMLINYIESQIISLQQGWSIISTYIEPVNPDVGAVLSNLYPNLTIAKNETGLIYWPIYNLNTIGNMIIGEGYQVKMVNPQILQVIGTIITPELTPFEISQGWNIIGYLRKTPASVEVMLSTIANNVVIIKNSNGLIYWPLYAVNTIGNMNPGEGYQIKMLITVTLLYPAN